MLPSPTMLFERVTVRASSHGEPPTVGGLGPLGCALAYRPDPAAFLTRMVEQVGPVFTLDLAGVRMTIVADPELLGTVHRAAESRLSARTAQAELGFEITLGSANVREATDYHRILLTQELRVWQGDLYEEQWRAVARALEREWESLAGGRADVLVAARRVSIRTTLETLVDPTLLDAHPDFLARYVGFQDRLEEATAKAMVLPRWFGDRLVLGPIRREREMLVEAIAPHVRRGETLAPFFRRLRDHVGDDPGAEKLATIVIGFLFAAHKNPAILAAQTLLFVLDDPRVLERVREELGALHGAERPSSVALPFLDRCIKETLRITQHSIGAVRRVEGGPLELGRYTVPEGRYLAISHAALGRAKGAWESPLRFDPDRFEDARAKHREHPYAYIPFSSGTHACPGQRIAIAFARDFVAQTLLRAPDLRVEGALPPLCFERATLAQREGEARVRSAGASASRTAPTTEERR